MKANCGSNSCDQSPFKGGNRPKTPSLRWQHMMEVSPMNRTFSIFVAAALLLGSSSAEAARATAGSNSNLLLPPQPPISSTQLIPQNNPIGGVNHSVGVVPASSDQFDRGRGHWPELWGIARRSRITYLQPQCRAATAIQSGWDIGFRHNYAKHQHWYNH